MTIPVYYRDLGERVLATFVQGFIGSLVVAQIADKEMYLAALGGGLAAVLSLGKGLLARKVGLPDSASLSKEV